MLSINCAIYLDYGLGDSPLNGTFLFCIVYQIVVFVFEVLAVNIYRVRVFGGSGENTRRELRRCVKASQVYGQINFYPKTK